jgi:hypothetical protein
VNFKLAGETVMFCANEFKLAAAKRTASNRTLLNGLAMEMEDEEDVETFAAIAVARIGSLLRNEQQIFVLPISAELKGGNVRPRILHRLREFTKQAGRMQAPHTLYFVEKTFVGSCNTLQLIQRRLATGS